MAPAGSEPSNESRIALRETGPFPAIGTEVSTAPDPVQTSDAGSFRVVELNLTTPSWRAALGRAVADRRPLDVRIVTDGRVHALTEAARALAGLEVLRVTPFDAATHFAGKETVPALRAALRAVGLRTGVLAGARSHFTELNRDQHRIPRDVDGIAVNTTPLFHSGDTEQLVEALAMQRLIAEQTVQIADGLPAHIGPLSLRPRFNNVATTAQPMPARDDLAEGFGAAFTGVSDERQRAPELAAWLVASAAALAIPGVASLSWFETAGPRGLAGTPTEEAFAALDELTGGILLSGESPDGLAWAIGSRRADEDVIVIANAGRAARVTSVIAPGGEMLRAHLAPGTWTRLVLPRK